MIFLNYNSFFFEDLNKDSYRPYEAITSYNFFSSYFKKTIKKNRTSTLCFKQLGTEVPDNCVLTRNKDIAKNVHKKFFKNSYLFNNYQINSKLSIFQNKILGVRLRDSFESDFIEDIEETSENLRYLDTNFPVKLIRGILNKHNIDTLRSSEALQSNLLFSYKLETSNIAEKISQVEQF